MALPHEEKPLGMQIPPVPSGAEIPAEPPDVGGRALSVASRLMAGASTFFFLAFVFAYFYLRSLNVENMFKPHIVKVSQGLGIIFVVCIILSAVLAAVSGRQVKAGNRAWTSSAIFSILLGVASVVVLCIELATQKWGPTRGAFASIYVTWTSLYMIAVLCTMYWLETNVATELRARREPATGGEGDIRDPDRLIAPAVDAGVFYWCYLAAIGVIMYVVLYLI